MPRQCRDGSCGSIHLGTFIKLSRTELSLSDEWETNQKLYEWLCAKYRFYPLCDVAATSQNRKCVEYFGKDKTFEHDRDGLSNTWFQRNWCNPPHSETELWVKKACKEFVENRNETMMIIPADSTCTQYAEACIEGIAEKYSIYERPKFKNDLQDKPEPARHSYYVIIWRRKLA